MSLNPKVRCAHRTHPMRRRLAYLMAMPVVLGSLLGGLVSPSHAISWDTNGATPGSGNAGGSWNTGTNWSTDASGSIATIGWTDGQQAVFSAGTDGVGVLNITAVGTVAPSLILVEEGQVVLNGLTVNSTGAIQIQRGTAATSLTLSGAGSTTATGLQIGNPLNLGGQTGTATLNVQGTHLLTINGGFLLGEQNGHAGNVVQTGGTVNANGEIRIGHWPNETSTYNISAGTLTNSATGLRIGWDGTGQMTVNGTADVNANAGTIIQRGSTLTVGGTATYDTTSFSIGDQRGQGTLTQTGGTITATGSFLLGHYPTNTAGFAGTYNGVYNMSGGALNLTGTANTEEGAGTLTIGVDGTGDVNHSGGTITAHRLHLNSRLNGAGGISTYDLTGSGILALRAGGITGNVSGGSGFALTFGGGTVRALQSMAINIPATLTSATTTTFDTQGNTFTVNGNLTGGGNLDLEGSNTGTVLFNGTSYALGTLNVGQGVATFNNAAAVVTAGTVNVGHNFSVGAGPGALTATLNIGPGTYTFAQMDLGNNSTAGVTVTSIVNQTGGDVSFTAGGKPDGAALRIGHYPSGTGFYNLSGGTLTILGGNALSTAIDGTGTFNQTGGIANATTVHVNSRGGAGGNGTFTVQGGRFNVGSGGIINQGTGPAAVNVGGSGGTLAASANWSSSLNMTLSGSGVNAATFDTNGNNINLSGILGGSGGLNKNGLGVLTLTNVNNYAGATVINAGTLNVMGSIAGGLVTVNNTATLGGEGTIGGATTAALGSIIAPGNGPGDIGTLTFLTSLDLNGTLLIDINGTGPGNADILDVNGLLDITGATLDFDLVGVINDPFYIFANYGSLTGQFASVVGAPGGYEIKYNFQGNNIALVAIPEPATMSLLALGGLGLLRRRQSVR